MIEQNKLRFKNKRRTFTQVDNEIVNNAALSWQAKGLMLYLLSKTDGWEFFESEIVKHATNGKGSVSSIIQELIDVGYLERGERTRNEKGHLGGYIYQISDFLVADYDGKAYIRFSNVGKSKVGKSDTSNTKRSNNTERSSNTNKEKEKEKDLKEIGHKEKPSSFLIDQEFINLQTFYKTYIANPDYTTNRILSELIDDYEEAKFIIEAIKVAQQKEKPPLVYAKGVLRNWRSVDGIQTYDQLIARREKSHEAYSVRTSKDAAKRHVSETNARRLKILQQQSG